MFSVNRDETMPLDKIDTQTWEPLKIFFSIFVLGGLAGLAALLRSKAELTARAVLSAILNSGFIALTIGLCWWIKYQDTNLYFLIGISVLAGLGGNTTIGILTALAQKRLNVNIDKHEPGDEN